MLCCPKTQINLPLDIFTFRPLFTFHPSHLSPLFPFTIFPSAFSPLCLYLLVGLVEKHHDQNPHHLLPQDEHEEAPADAADHNNNEQMTAQMAQLQKEVMGAVKLMGELYKEISSLKKEVKELKSENGNGVRH
jgi:hypothetical protein